jgi:hypothetical protein
METNTKLSLRNDCHFYIFQSTNVETHYIFKDTPETNNIINFKDNNHG